MTQAKSLSRKGAANLDWFTTQNTTITRLNCKGSFSMVAVLDKTKTFAMLDTHLLDGSSTKCMEETMKHILSNLVLRTPRNH